MRSSFDNGLKVAPYVLLPDRSGVRKRTHKWVAIIVRLGRGIFRQDGIFGGGDDTVVGVWVHHDGVASGAASDAVGGSHVGMIKVAENAG